MKHIGNLTITAKNAAQYADVVEVTGYLSIDAPAKLNALKRVGWGLYIYAPATLDALESTGGSLHINADAKLDALKSVGRDLYIYADAKLDARALESVGGSMWNESKQFAEARG
jgi:hypothetical protein